MNRAARQQEWLVALRFELVDFLMELRDPGQPGRFRPCRHGAVAAGESASLGFSCFARKILDATGMWSAWPAGEQQGWLDWIRAFQVVTPGDHRFGAEVGMFVDPDLIGAIPEYREGWKAGLRRRWHKKPKPTPRQDAMLAETKQAIATLAWAGVEPVVPFGAFPCQQRALLARLQSFDWSLPWSAGARSALLAVFVQSQSPHLPGVDGAALRQTLVGFLDGMVDPSSGCYFRPPTLPARGQLINGAMKVLNALEWLAWPIHYPERLIDTCLLQGPPPAGCHVVDWVYVVYRSLQQTDHRRAEVQQECLKIVDLIRTHWSRDRGFSYSPGQAQTGYYGATISFGLDEGDLHGSCLLTWALAMIVEILEWPLPGWKPFRA